MVVAANNQSNDDDKVPLPANDTKHLTNLIYPLPKFDCTFDLSQVAGDGSTTGSSLWLSSQILVCYLQEKYDRRKKIEKEIRCGQVIELGAGIGLTSLVLERLGWQVSSTDISPPLHTVLQPNVNKNSQGKIKVFSLDWTKFSEDVIEQDEFQIDLIVTADTIYQPTLVDGLCKTIQRLLKRASKDCKDERVCSSKKSLSSSFSSSQRSPHALIALERRDDEQVNSALRHARESYQLILKQISPREIRKSVDAHFGSSQKWPRQVWDDVEIWRVNYEEPKDE